MSLPLLLVLLAPMAADGADVPHLLEVRLVLCQRTYPRLGDNSTARLGPILYPKYVDLRGDVLLYGDAEYVRKAAQAIRTLDSREILQRFRIHIFQTKDGQQTLLPNAVRSIRIDEVRVFSPAQQGFPPDQRDGVSTLAKFQFSASVGESTWTDGHYLLSTEWRAGANLEPRTLGTRIQPFEVRSVKPGGADEINLLTNALGMMVPGLAARLQEQGRYQVEKMPGRILELDEHDVWIRVGQAEMALQMVRPQEAVEFYDAAWKEVSAGTALRAEVIWKIMNPGVRPRYTSPHWTTQDLFALRIKQVKQQAMTFNAVRDEVETLHKEKGIPALLELVRTPRDSSLDMEQDRLPKAMFAIRLLGESSADDVNQTLVSELRKLPAENYSGHYQREIVEALARIHERPDKKIDWLVLTPEQNIDVVRWWQKRPKEEKKGESPSS